MRVRTRKKPYTGEVWIGLNGMAYDFNQYYIQLKWDIVESVCEINKIYRWKQHITKRINIFQFTESTKMRVRYKQQLWVVKHIRSQWTSRYQLDLLYVWLSFNVLYIWIYF